jgi:bifunctional non-homologous end joining protein LigD
MGGLGEYHRKRDFTRTPEPRGEKRSRPGAAYVVQKHAARRLHYDFRLELDGVLKSWAVPKGPSIDPEDKRLAVQTEDHPVDYGSFEGVIPKGQYGAGAVLLWDRGTWEPVEDPHQGLRAGKLKFRVRGEKLRGGWTLVKIRERGERTGGNSWLLIKERDEHARPAVDLTVARPESVATGRSLEEVAGDADRVWRPSQPAPAALPRARRAALPQRVEPQLATPATEPPAGDAWLHEIKFDGYRLLCRIEGERVRLSTRTGQDWTERLPSVARAVRALGVRTALLDGEVAVVLPDGTTSFHALQNVLGPGGGGAPVYFVFDLLHLDGYDLTAAPLEVRKTALRDLLGAATASPAIRYSDHVVGAGTQFFREARRLGLEGVISKRRDAPYTPGRGRAWLKVKCVQEQELVVGGFTDPEGGRQGLGALLVGVYDRQRRLAYAGRVGTGFSDVQARQLRRRLERIEQSSCPFAGPVPRVPRVHWVAPELVAQVAFAEWTPDGRLRHPSFRGLREDRPAREVVREEPARSRSGRRVTRKGR